MIPRVKLFLGSMIIMLLKKGKKTLSFTFSETKNLPEQ